MGDDLAAGDSLCGCSAMRAAKGGSHRRGGGRYGSSNHVERTQRHRPVAAALFCGLSLVPAIVQASCPHRNETMAWRRSSVSFALSGYSGDNLHFTVGKGDT